MSDVHALGRSRVGLVLGAGGPVGHAFHAGVLRALHEVWGWEAQEAELVVGTSAGAQVGALVRAGMSARDLMARIAGAPLSIEGSRIASHFQRPDYAITRGRRRLRPASPEYLVGLMRAPWQAARLGSLLAAFLPPGRVSLEAMAEGLTRLFAGGWPERSLWIPALELRSGRRVVWGRPESRPIDVGRAVTSSGAVPGIVAPVQVHDGHYVDGGMISLTHLDLVEDTDVDVVIVSSPLSRFLPMRVMLARAVRRLEKTGRRVLVFEPQGSVRRAIGYNPMDPHRAAGVGQAAYESTCAKLKA